MNWKSSVVALGLTVPALALAQTPAAEPAPAPEAEPAKSWADRVKVEGLVDSYFAYRVEGDRTPSEYRAFDAENKVFQIAYAELALSVPAEPAGVRIDIGFGPVADGTSSDGVGNTFFKQVQQAYASLKVPVLNGITIDAGKFVTNAGAEVIEAKDNWLYTRSFLFTWAIPFAHTGLRANAALTDSITFQAGLTNGWDVISTDAKFKTVNASVFYAGGSTSGAVNIYAGPEGTKSDEWRFLADLVLTQNLGDSFALNLNCDVATEGDAMWYGAALMARYQVAEHVRVAVRGEYFNDADGARLGVKDLDGNAVGASLMGGTLGASYLVGGNGEIRAEIRRDQASEDVFAGGTSAGQTTGTVAFLGYF